MFQMPISQTNKDTRVIPQSFYPPPPFPVDPISYNNCVLTHNIAYLSSLQVHDLFQIRAENEKFKAENSELKSKNGDLEKDIAKIKKRLADYEDDLKHEKSHNAPDYKRHVTSRFKPYHVNSNQYSWSEEKVQETIGSIKTVSDIIGLNGIKKDIFKKIVYYIQNPHNDEYLHTIISGPPGVGKTEFAKIYADIFVRLGVLNSDKFIEIKRDDLVGQYLGQTAPRTRKLLEEAMDGVLFLDEAYSLGNQEKRDSFSKEAIDMINQYLSERKGKFMFIVAGYEDELNSCLFAHNRGMRRRFHSHYNIEGYKPSELNQIFIRKLNLVGYNTLVPTTELDKFFKENKEHFEYFGGDIEKLVNEIKQVQSLRTFYTNTKSREVIMSDIVQSLKNIEEKKETNGPPPSMYV